MQGNSNHPSAQSSGLPKSKAGSAWLTVIGLTADGRFFREKTSYSFEGDGFHFQSKHAIAENTALLLEIENHEPGQLPTVVNARAVSVAAGNASGLFALVARQDGVRSREETAPKPSTPAVPALTVASAAVKPPSFSPTEIADVAPQKSAAANARPGPVAAPALPPALQPSTVLPTSAAAKPLELAPAASGLEQPFVFEAEPAPAPAASEAAHESLVIALSERVESLLREQLKSRLQLLVAETRHLRAEQLAPILDDASAQLKARVREESERLAGEYREKFKQLLEKDLEAAQARTSSSAVILDRLCAQAADELQAQKAEIRQWSATFRESLAQNAAATGDEILRRICAQMETEFQSKFAVAQEELEQKFSQSKQSFMELLQQIEQGRSDAVQALQSVETAQQAMETMREDWQAEIAAEESKLQEAALRAAQGASDETRRLLNDVMEGFAVRLRKQMTDWELASQAVVAQATQQLEASAAEMRKSESAAAGQLAQLDASLARSAQAIDTLQALHANNTSQAQQELSAWAKHLFVQFQKQLNEQCQRITALHLTALERQTMQQKQSAEDVLLRLADEKTSIESASLTHKATLQAETARSLEQFHTDVAQSSQRLRAEVEAATRLAHQALEQDFSLKLKYLGESISNLVRMLFQTSTESKESK